MAQLNVGEPAPDFTLPAAGGGTVSTAELRAQTTEGLIVYFYPKAATPGCTTQACDFRDNLASLQGAGYAVLGVSPDPVGKLEAFADAESLPFPLASDEDHSMAEAWGAWGEKKNYGRTYVGLIRSTVVVAPSGEVTLAQYNVKATGHVSRLRKKLGLD
ncbi:MAG TPA: thioredoxin-dependent thiol peroxidase [Actinomycetaceae bacterium]|nr:thioredoxin-dependent thiol peroxidase [Actinomycetaceae bacterium]